MERDYSDAFEPLRHVHLEDSWVLEVRPSESAVAFRLDVVLTEGHPDYQGARPGEQHDYRPSDLLITGELVEAQLSGAPAAVDADGLRDLGNIDSWRTGEDGWSLLQGEWGHVRVLSPQVRLTVGPRE